MSCTLGQPDASGPLTNGNFSVTGGFWSLLIVVPTEGAPLLTITRTITNTAIVSWPSPATGWNLQQDASVVTTNWVSPPPNGGNRAACMTLIELVTAKPSR